MPETYATLAAFSQIGGLFMFIAGFAVVLFYALKPSRQRQFDAAARAPLQED